MAHQNAQKKNQEYYQTPPPSFFTPYPISYPTYPTYPYFSSRTANNYLPPRFQPQPIHSPPLSQPPGISVAQPVFSLPQPMIPTENKVSTSSVDCIFVKSFLDSKNISVKIKDELASRSVLISSFNQMKHRIEILKSELSAHSLEDDYDVVTKEKELHDLLKVVENPTTLLSADYKIRKRKRKNRWRIKQVQTKIESPPVFKSSANIVQLDDDIQFVASFMSTIKAAKAEHLRKQKESKKIQLIFELRRLRREREKKKGVLIWEEDEDFFQKVANKNSNDTFVSSPQIQRYESVDTGDLVPLVDRKLKISSELRDFYFSAEKNMSCLVRIRRAWDQYIVDSDTEGSSSIPMSWVDP
ncbi:hypothetical protein HK096_010494, partial [Nowakowskiella sp. JEL0078]